MTQHPAFDILTATCPSRTSLARIASKWTAMVVIALTGGPLRFRDLRTTVDGIVTRHSYAEVPPRVEYELTDLGRSLHAPLEALGRWAEEHMAEVMAAREDYGART